MKHRELAIFVFPTAFDNHQLSFARPEAHADEIVEIRIPDQQRLPPHPLLPVVDRRDQSGQPRSAITRLRVRDIEPSASRYRRMTMPSPPIDLDHGFDLESPVEQLCATTFLHPHLVFDIHSLRGITPLIVEPARQLCDNTRMESLMKTVKVEGV